MRGLALVLTGALTALLDPTPQVGGERCLVEPHYTFYEVAGASAPEIEASLREHGPRDDRGKARFAFTDWIIEWNWKKTDTGAVDPNTLALRCSAEIHLPRLRVSPATPVETIRLWHAFVERTRLHELAHLEHVQGGAMRIKERILKAHQIAGPLTTARANKIVSNGVQALRELDVAYDARTNHGYVEGTWKVEGEGASLQFAGDRSVTYDKKS